MITNINGYFFLFFCGGVTGRPELKPAYWYLAFFSEGFKIYSENKTAGVRTRRESIEGGREYLEGAHEGFIHRHHSASVIKLPTVIRSREKRHQLSFGEEFIAIFHHLRERYEGEEQLGILDLGGCLDARSKYKPDGLGRWGPSHVGWGTWPRHQHQKWRKLLGHSPPTHMYPYQGLTTRDHTANLWK